MPGLVEAIVIDNLDPAQLGRVKVQYPSLPEIGDEVLDSFMHGDVQHAIVVGALYNGVDKPPYANEDKENNLRVFQSRSGHRVTFDDTGGKERIELVTHNEEIRVVWDAANKILSVYSGGDIQVEAKNHINVEADVFSVSAADSVNIEAGTGLIIEAGSVVGVLGGSQVQILPDIGTEVVLFQNVGTRLVFEKSLCVPYARSESSPSTGWALSTTGETSASATRGRSSPTCTQPTGQRTT